MPVQTERKEKIFAEVPPGIAVAFAAAKIIKKQRNAHCFADFSY